METISERPYKVMCTLPDGQRVLVGDFKDVNEARKLVAGLSEYWPGDYSIVRSNSEQGVPQ
jgi:hypothetical protein